VRVLAIALLAGALAALASAPSASALAMCPDPSGPYVVGTKADEHDGSPGNPAGPDGLLSLREAVTQANNDGTNSAIVLGAGVYHVSGSALAINTNCNLSIDGAGARSTTIQGDGAHGVVNTVNSSPTTITALTITGGLSDVGGGILNQGDLDLSAVTIRGNTATDNGGGIASSGTLTVESSTLSGNRASPPEHPSTVASGRGQGGAVYNSGTATLTNTTVSGNSAGTGSDSGHQPGNGGGVMNVGTFNVVSSTLADNTSTGLGGDFYNAGGTVETLNSLYVRGKQNANCGGTLPFGSNSSGDNSMSSDSTCTGTATPNLNLGPLQNNGGPTDTQALLAGSAAIDGGESTCPTPSDFPKFDQRGIVRPTGACDVGTFELVKDANLAVTMKDSPDPVGQRAPSGLTYTIKVKSTGPAKDATQPTVKDVLPAGVALLKKHASQGSCAGTTTITCALGTLANGATATIAIKVKAVAPGPISNTASVTSPRPDATPGDDHATATTAVSPSDLADVIVGTPKADKLCGLLGNDTIKGLAGDDTIYGDNCGRKKGPGGNDKLNGGPGNDKLVGGGGKNRYKGGPGNDRILARNGKKDKIDCGSGKKDYAKVDKSDTVKGCETVKRP
jgi:uncharacterized repeat protein (TIGR01451 family)